jgi:hypothetical protein
MIYLAMYAGLIHSSGSVWKKPVVVSLGVTRDRRRGALRLLERLSRVGAQEGPSMLGHTEDMDRRG